MIKKIFAKSFEDIKTSDILKQLIPNIDVPFKEDSFIPEEVSFIAERENDLMIVYKDGKIGRMPLFVYEPFTVTKIQ